MKLLLFLLLMSYYSTLAIKHGVVIKQKGEVTWLSETYNLVSTLDLNEVLKKIKSMQQTISYAMRIPHAEHELAKHFSDQLTQMRHCLLRKQGELEAFIQVNEEPQSNRAKRSLAGTFVASLFDLATVDDIDKIVRQVNENNAKTESIVNKMA